MTSSRPPEFHWDEANTRHLARHKVTEAEFEQAMRNDPIVIDSLNVEGEDRWSVLGATDSLRVLVLCYTLQDVKIRPVTAWAANKRLRELYFRHKEL